MYSFLKVIKVKNNFIKKTLKNGVKLYLFVDPKMKQTYCSYGVFYGSSGEYLDFYLDGTHHHVLPGCAHFLEHLLGEHSKYGNIYKNFAKKKYSKNGGTNNNITNYFFIGIEDIKESIKELINSIDDPIYTEEDIDETRKAIIEEVNMVSDNKYRKANSLCLRNMFNNKEVITDTLCSIGDANTTKKITKEMLDNCYNAFYNDENKFLIIAGNINEEEMTSYIESIYKDLKPHPKKMEYYDYGKSLDVRKEEDIIYMPTSDDIALMGFKLQKNDFSNIEISIYLEFIFDSKFSDETTFVKKLKDKNIITRFDVCSKYFLKDEVYFSLGATTPKYKTFLKKLKEELILNNFKEKDFELFIRVLISTQLKRVDKKYKTLRNFPYELPFTENFDDIEYIKTLTFEKFLNFYQSLDFDTNSVVIIRDPKNK